MLAFPPKLVEACCEGTSADLNKKKKLAVDKEELFEWCGVTLARCVCFYRDGRRLWQRAMDTVRMTDFGKKIRHGEEPVL